MLGWPSSVFPQLLNKETSEVLITLDQSAMIAGFLMYGNSAGVLFSSIKYTRTKAPIGFCLAIQIIGWLLMFFADNIVTILVSRFFVGFANGLGTTQIKIYITETCNKDMATFLCKYLNVTVFLGVLLSYFIGAFFDFRPLSLYGIGMPAVGLIFFLLIPKYKSTEDKAKDVEATNSNNDDEHSVFEIITDSSIRNNVTLIFIVVIIQQYTGGASNIVYSQIIFAESNIILPKIIPIFYATGLLLFTTFSITKMYKLSIKSYLIFSCTFVSLINFSLSLYFNFKNDLLHISSYFTILPLLLLLGFTAFHNFGIAIVPFIILSTKLPKFTVHTVNKIYVITFSLAAVTSTKLFQYFFTYYDMATAYMAYSLIAFTGLLITMIFVKNTKKSVDLTKAINRDMIEITYF